MIRETKQMNLILSADKNWGIGKDNKLLVRIPADMKQFRRKTKEKTVIMGRKTLESLPGGQPLENRTNIILTRDKNYRVKGAAAVHTMDELKQELEGTDSDQVYVIGGASIYEQLLPYCNVAYVTKIDYTYEADRYFPDLDASPEWEVTDRSPEQTYFDLEYEYIRYERKS